MTDYPGLEWVIRQRIEQYKNDIKCVEMSEDKFTNDEERIRQDRVIIEELNKILTGVGLEMLSYV